MYLTGFADEAAPDIDGQIRATKTLGWTCIEARNIDGVNIHDLPDDKFDLVVGKLQEAGVQINCFGSTIANWAKSIMDPFDITAQEIRRTIPRMQRLGCKMIRIMSYAVLKDREPDDQMEKERFRRLAMIRKMFADAGITAVHENCMNYGGMSAWHTARLVEHVAGLKLVFDTGNPVFLDDRSKRKPYPKQSSWDFYTRVKDDIAYIHIKDGIWDPKSQQMKYMFAGEGQGDVFRILKDLIQSGYDGGVSIEPHLSVVYHDPSVASDPEQQFNNYVEYGRRVERMVNSIRGKPLKA